MVSGLVTSPCDQERIFSGEASWILMASKSMMGPRSSNGLERNIVGVSVYSSALAGAAGGLRLPNLFRDDFRRIAMPVVLVQVLIFDCGVAVFLPGLKPP